MLRKSILVLTTVTLALSLTACNTVKGAGTDLKSASKSTEDAMNGRH